MRALIYSGAMQEIMISVFLNVRKCQYTADLPVRIKHRKCTDRSGGPKEKRLRDIEEYV